MKSTSGAHYVALDHIRAVAALLVFCYSIYLLHFFVVFSAADWIHRKVIDLSCFYVALPVAIVAFAAMVPIGYVSMRWVEAPFLRLRKPYYRP